MTEYTLLFNTSPIVKRCLAYLSVIDVDLETNNLACIEVIGVLRNSECVGTNAHFPETLPAGVTYHQREDVLDCVVGAGTIPYGQIHQPKIQTWILLSETEEISGVAIRLPPEVNKPPGVSVVAL